MNTKAMITDQELIMAFSNVKPVQTKEFEAVFAGDMQKTFNARNKTEALRIAREYGSRIINAKLIGVYAVEAGN